MKIDERDFIQFLTIKRKLAGNSIRTYSGRLRIIKKWLFSNNAELTKQSVENFLYEKKEKEKLSNAAVNTYIQTLNHIESYSRDRGLPAGFMDGIEGLPKTQSEIIPLSTEEIDALLNTHLEYKNRNGVNCDNLDFKYLTLTAFIVFTGLRYEEAASLQVKRLDIENGRATIVNTKNKHNRFVFIHHDPLKKALRDLAKGRSPEDLVFTNSKNQHVHAGDFNYDLQLRAQKAGITKHVHAHLLRHSFATELQKATHDIAGIATILGHKDIKTTYESYVHLDTETLQRFTQKFPLLRKYIKPIDVLKDVKLTVDGYKLDDDERFSYNASIGEKGLEIKIMVK